MNKGKGKSYHADTSEDLYERMRISMDLCEELNKELDYRIAIFSFPMRYIPLSNTTRGFVGARWNAKYLRALQRMLIPTQGKGVSSRSFFEADFRKSAEEFVMYLAMPEEHLGWRGHFLETKGETQSETRARKKVWDDNQSYLEEWKRLFSMLGDTKDTFIGYKSKFEVFKQKVIEQAVAGEVGVEYIQEQTEKQLDLLGRKLSLIGE